MNIKTLMGSRSRENPSHVKFRTQMDAAVRSVTPGARVDPAVVEGMLALVRSKEISPGDALSCFKTHLREGAPDEQYNTLRVLVQFVDTDPHLANMLHMELASKRWRERFVILAGSAHPEVRPLLVATLQTWSAAYRAHDIGMHYNSTLRELASGGASLRTGGPGYTSQYTGYSAQQTGYSTQPTGAGYPMPPPPPGYPLPVPAGYPAAAPGYPPYGPPYPPQPMPQAAPRRAPETVPQKLEQLVSEVEVLRGAIRNFETTLADYKAQRCDFSALSSAMAKGQRSADRCTSLQSHMEGLLGNADTDEGLMGRVFSTNDAVVAALEQWGRLANQELAPEDTPATASAAAAASASAGPSAGSPGPSAAPATSRPPPSPIDLLLGDELPAPAPPAAPAAAAAAAAAAPFGGAPAGGATEWNAFPSPPTPAAPLAAPGADAAAGAAAGVAALFAVGGVTAAGPASTPVVPANDMEGLREQVLALASELEKERKMHKTAMDTQEAFHKQELAQVKAQAQARIAELEAALGLAREAPLQQLSSAGPSAGLGPTPGSFTSASSAAAPGSALYPLPSGAPAAAPPAPPPPLPSGLSSNNPFAPTFATMPSYGSVGLPPPPPPNGGGAGGPFASLGSLPAPLGSLTSPAAAPPALTPAPASTAAPAAPADILSAFDDLAVLPSKPAGAAPSTPAAAFGSGSAMAPKAANGAAGSGVSWVNFGH
ncbi:hypothetical protein PLESTB_000166900 [Pleodorina starrii]|uniref:VHS domain-containing protein n=1 Tax=Pleodorina starrii TaxID=330485 RepID=A0A9W6BBA0_9CHLO|nr:hypothetical protein PLESTM_002064700 [Pleodorina starrii]GLC48956.1 hypothetical protein PLESTB_000166900 [Pleodorina starrii]GLC72682.1 hypothetical protein PLESTF_001278100 [Pleodorina starrii]